MKRYPVLLLAGALALAVAPAANGQEASSETRTEALCVMVETSTSADVAQLHDVATFLGALSAGAVNVLSIGPGQDCDGLAPTESAVPAPVATAIPTPEPTVEPARLSWTADVRGTKRALSSQPITYKFNVKNIGGQPHGFDVLIDGPSGHARYIRCSPSCLDEDEWFGERTLVFGPVPPGKTRNVELRYTALDPSRYDWSICLDTDQDGGCDDDLHEANGTTVIAQRPGFDGEGIYRVGKDIRPGLYRAQAAVDGFFKNCYWARLRNFKGTLDSIIANDNTSGTTTVRILKSDKGFEASGCTRFVRIGN